MSKLNEIIKKYGVNKLNTATKYPSIMTYHDLGDKASLVESLVEGKDFFGYDNCYITEKIDGANARIIFVGGADDVEQDYIIGSREELLFAKGDRFGDPTLNIANTIKNVAEKLTCFSNDSINVLFGEVYGGDVTKASKQYTNDKSFGFRVFDIAEIPLSIFEQ